MLALSLVTLLEGSVSWRNIFCFGINRNELSVLSRLSMRFEVVHVAVLSPVDCI